MWYLDCFTDQDEPNRQFPVNSYCSPNLMRLLGAAGRVLTNEVSGIKRVAIGHETKGQSPLEIVHDYWPL